MSDLKTEPSAEVPLFEELFLIRLIIEEISRITEPHFLNELSTTAEFLFGEQVCDRRVAVSFVSYRHDAPTLS